MYGQKRRVWLPLVIGIAGSVMISGCSDDDDDEVALATLSPMEFSLSMPLGTVQAEGGVPLALDTGFGSGAFHHAADPEQKFYLVTDRGPNVACDDAEAILGVAAICGDDEDGKIFPMPEYTPSIFEVLLTTDGPQLTQIPLLDSDGNPISGVVNPLESTENGYALDGTLLAFDPNGVDTEALVKLADGSFWLTEEYGPSLLHVATDGSVLERVVPEGVAAQLTGATYPVTDGLPAILAKRKLNRGIESLAINPDETALYFIMQSPLANPDNSAYSGSKNVRLFKLALNADGTLGAVQGEYLYTLDSPQSFADRAGGEGDLKNNDYRKQSDVKVSEMIAVGDDQLVVLERISKITHLYRVDLAGATNLLGSAWDSEATSPSLEQIVDLQGEGIVPLAKSLAFTNLGSALELAKKEEGLAMLDGTYAMLINDNDFGISGDTTDVVITPFNDRFTGMAAAHPVLVHESRYGSGLFDEGAAEIVQYHAASQRSFVVNAADRSVDVLTVGDDLALSKAFALTLPAQTADDRDLGDANSVAVSGDWLAVAIEADDGFGNSKQGKGVVVLYDIASGENALTADSAPVAMFEAGYLPDMVTFNKAGNLVLVANEGEPNSAYDVDPEGSVTLIDLSHGVDNADITHLGFTDFNVGGSRHSALPADVRVFGPNATVAQDLEPEYIAVAEDDTMAFVALQENNAVANIDLINKQVTAIWALGFKDHGKAWNAIDINDKDDVIDISTHDNVVGMYQPDAIASYSVDGMAYLITANEGDARDYDGFSEEARGEDLPLTDSFDLDEVGRIGTTTTLGDADNDGVVETLHIYGARSFSIWNSAGERVFDSGSEFEQITAARFPDNFNASDNKHSFENRSDNKGPEPEGVAVGKVGDRFYAFIGLERIGGVMVYDVTVPAAARLVQYINPRDFEQDPSLDTDDGEVTNPLVGDLAPEGMVFVAAADSPTGAALLIVGNEVSGTTSLYSFD
ncbi:esterase-like activity of phytase family protein [Corallincola holothuriorum]|uniref:Esterase-like activity of phytase family protein n=1 Tax=Corallincola holothuriorum TaxID=2282215 RepID=A0A368MY85_9GAMM|nr:choice-of-anchor I family protein [Corallincola holothuriorum]RCU42890.1 esterase-like activity of phytase family protein [Corallincola holothuriorum]